LLFKITCFSDSQKIIKDILHASRVQAEHLRFRWQCSSNLSHGVKINGAHAAQILRDDHIRFKSLQKLSVKFVERFILFSCTGYLGIDISGCAGLDPRRCQDRSVRDARRPVAFMASSDKKILSATSAEQFCCRRDQ